MAGTKQRIVAPVSIDDHGTAAARGSVTVTVYASTDTAVSADDAVVAPTVHKSLTGSVNATRTLTVVLKGLPASLATGDYHLIARVTDSAGLAQSGARVGTIAVAAPVVVPAVAFTSVRDVGRSGHEVLTLQLTNGGNVPLASAVTVTLYITAAGSLDAAPDLPADAGQITSVVRRVNVPPGRGKAVVVTPATRPGAGDYWLAVVTTAATATGAPPARTVKLDLPASVPAAVAG